MSISPRRATFHIDDSQRLSSPRTPPSSFAFPFLAHPGNPDPIPRRTSTDSLSYSRSGSLTDLRRPHAPFMSHLDSSSSSTSLYRNSHAGHMSYIQTSPSQSNFRAPFLSPASRPSSSVWSPPSTVVPYSPSSSSSALPLPKKAPLPSTRLSQPLPTDEKPWLAAPSPRARLSKFITFLGLLLGILAAAAVCYTGYISVPVLLPSRLCSVLDDSFDASSLDGNAWNQVVEIPIDGFHMSTNSQDNLYTAHSQLYIHPTFTTDTVKNVLNGGNYTLPGCTPGKNKTSCTATSNDSRGTVINPVLSAHITTAGKKTIKYGRVEIKAKLPKGDWLHPLIQLLPADPEHTYGIGLRSGQIAVLDARGNAPSYPGQGSNFVRASLTYGPLPTVIHQIFGWYSMKQTSFDKEFHTYALEWDDKFMRFYTDSRIHSMLDLRTTGKKDGFWERAGFPETTQNGSTQVTVDNPYEGKPKSAPFDQSFYLSIDLGAGGTTGWFPDNLGGKPWFDKSQTAMRDFARMQDTWAATWPSSAEDRSFRIDYVKMWTLC